MKYQSKFKISNAQWEKIKREHDEIWQQHRNNTEFFSPSTKEIKELRDSLGKVYSEIQVQLRFGQF